MPNSLILVTGATGTVGSECGSSTRRKKSHARGCTDVGGNVSILDGSGAIEVEHVDGTVQVEDGSGDMFIRDVSGDVLIVDGSGDINVDTVGGDLIVLADSSGRIRFRNVSGRVELPD